MWYEYNSVFITFLMVELGNLHRHLILHKYIYNGKLKTPSFVNKTALFNKLNFCYVRKI